MVVSILHTDVVQIMRQQQEDREWKDVDVVSRNMVAAQMATHKLQDLTTKDVLVNPSSLDAVQTELLRLKGLIKKVIFFSLKFSILHLVFLVK